MTKSIPILDDDATAISLSANEVRDLHDALTNAADDLDSEGLGDTDSCLDARRWAKRFEGLKGGK